MPRALKVRGAWRATGEPNWEPLERILPLQLCGPFMWMGEVEATGGGWLGVYKHSSSRRYFHLDALGAPYRYLDLETYCRLGHYDAIEAVFTPTWLLHDATEGDKELLEQALSDAVERDDADWRAGLNWWTHQR